jgi:hypothetical protein
LSDGAIAGDFTQVAVETSVGPRGRLSSAEIDTVPISREASSARSRSLENGVGKATDAGLEHHDRDQVSPQLGKAP